MSIDTTKLLNEALSLPAEARAPSPLLADRRTESSVRSAADDARRADAAPAAAALHSAPAGSVAATPSVADAARRESVVGAAAQSRAGATAEAKRAEAELTPQAWLERIAELRKQGREREAQESLAEFKKRHPDYKIPESLR